MLFSRPRKFYCNFRATARCATKLSRGITQFNFDDGHRTATAVFAEFFAIAVLIFAQSSYALASDQPYLIDLANVVPDNEGQIVNIAGGRAIAKKGIAQHLQSDDLVLVRVRGDDASGWAWVRDGAPGVDYNTDSQPIEFAWYPFEQGQDLAPFLDRLKQNWGDKLFWRPPAVDARMSFIDWGHMHTLVMKAPLADIVIYNIVDSDKSHPATVGNRQSPVSHHRMWYFPAPPKVLQVGEAGSQYRVTFRDESFDTSNPWRWTQGSRWRVQAGNCKNPYYQAGAINRAHESFYPRIRWFSGSGLISIDVPKARQAPEESHEVQIHADFNHTWGDGLFIQSAPLAKNSSRELQKRWVREKAGRELLDITLSGKFYDSGVTIRAHGEANPIRSLTLLDVVFSDPYSQGTNFPGTGAARAQLDGVCSSLANRGLDLGVLSKASGRVTFEYGAAGLQGFLVRDLSGLDADTPFEMTYSSIGYSIDGQHSWDARPCCVPKIDGFTSHPNNKPIRLKINVKGPFKQERVHTPLAIEWGKDDAGNIEIARPVEASMQNSLLHLMPAPPLIPPTHYPEVPSARITQTINHEAIAIRGNPWARLSSRMTLGAGSELPFGLVLTGFIDKDGKHDDTRGDPIDAATIIESTRITGAEDIMHSASGDANSAIRLGHGTYPPPKYVWIKGPIEFDNVARDGQLIYSPAWHGLRWTLRIDSPLQAGVRIKLGDAQSYTGKTLEKATWSKNQIASPRPRTGSPGNYYAAVAKKIDKGSSYQNTRLWREIDNPFDGLTLIYLGREYRLGKRGAIISEDGEIEILSAQ